MISESYFKDFLIKPHLAYPLKSLVSHKNYFWTPKLSNMAIPNCLRAQRESLPSLLHVDQREPAPT